MRLNPKLFIILLICLTFVSLVAEPKQNGFYCNDPSIREPFIELQISLFKLLSTSIIIPILIIILVENLWKGWSQTPVKQSIHRNISVFMFGVLMNFLSVMLSKNLFGRLRPHTIQFCNASHYCSEDFDKYINEFECHNNEVPGYMLKNARHSFYSGHASIAVYSGVYLVLYLRSKLKPKSKILSLMLSIIYCLVVITSLYPGFTQWYTYWHFASDVLTGYTIGLMSSIVIFKLFPTETTTDPKNSINYMPLNRLLSTAFLSNH